MSCHGRPNWPFALRRLIVLLLLLLVSLLAAVGAQVPIGTVIVAEQHFQQPPTPAGAVAGGAIASESTKEEQGKGNKNNNNAPSELVDQVESIDVGSTQLVVATTRQGPPDTARVAIDVEDIANGEQMPPMNLTGILLVLTRGRYTVNWLRPNRWYGLFFRAEQHYNGGMAVYANEEAHLVKTHRADGSHEEGKPLVSVRAQRFGDGGHSLENLVLTVRWEQHPEERLNLDALANITLFCSQQIKYRQMRLRANEIDKSVEIRLDNHFEVVEQRNGSARQMVASIRPKNCPRICWNAELVAETRRRSYRRPATHSCEEIPAISATAILRDFAGYELGPGGDLVVHTNFTVPGEQPETAAEEVGNNELDGYVQLAAIPLPEFNRTNGNGNGNENSTVRYKTFNTNRHGEQFVLDRLERGRLYAVQYTYGKQSPFAYEESRRFLVDTGSALEPLLLDFDISGPFSLQPGVVVSARLEPKFRDYRVGVDMEPLCEPEEKTQHFWLDSDHGQRELRELPVLDALCTAGPSHSICRAPGTAATLKGCAIRGGKLCYTSSIVVHEKLFSAERKCLPLAKLVPQLPSTTTSTTTTSTGSHKQFGPPNGTHAVDQPGLPPGAAHNSQWQHNGNGTDEFAGSKSAAASPTAFLFTDSLKSTVFLVILAFFALSRQLPVPMA